MVTYLDLDLLEYEIKWAIGSITMKKASGGDVKNLPANAGDTGDLGSIPGSGRSLRGGNGTHSSILASKIPWMEDLEDYSPWGHKESDMTEHTHTLSGGDGIPAELFKILKDDAVKVLSSICQQIWKTQQWPQDWKRSVFIPISKKGNVK